MKDAKRALRKEQRQEAVRQRSEKAQEITSAENDRKTFLKLINNQRKSSKVQTHSLNIDGKPLETPEKIC